MYETKNDKNNRIRSYLCILILCLCLSACSKGEPEFLEEAVETHIDQDLPTVIRKEFDETELDAESTEKESTASEYILSESDSRYYTVMELSHLTTTDLRLARNEIFARHGRIFTVDDLRLCFAEKSWYSPQYTPKEFDQMGDAIFNKFEIANCNQIVMMEQLEGYKDILKQKKFRRLYVSTERFQDNKQPDAQVIDHGSYYEVTHGCIVGDTSFDQTVMDGKRVGDTLELDNRIYRIKEIAIWDLGDGETVNLELVSGEEELEECYALSRDYRDSYYTPYYYDGVMKTDILYSGSLYFSKDCMIKVNDPQNGYRSHNIPAEDFFTLDGDEVGEQFGGRSGGLSLWGEFETDLSGVIVSYWESFLS